MKTSGGAFIAASGPVTATTSGTAILTTDFADPLPDLGRIGGVVTRLFPEDNFRGPLENVHLRWANLRILEDRQIRVDGEDNGL